MALGSKVIALGLEFLIGVHAWRWRVADPNARANYLMDSQAVKRS